MKCAIYAVYFIYKVLCCNILLFCNYSPTSIEHINVICCLFYDISHDQTNKTCLTKMSQFPHFRWTTLRPGFPDISTTKIIVTYIAILNEIVSICKYIPLFNLKIYNFLFKNKEN